MNKIKCCKCSKQIATWYYMPGGLTNGDFYCDDCVPRGCSCNQYHLDEFNEDEINNDNVIYWDENLVECTAEKNDLSKYFEPVDKNGRRFPCCEFDYDSEGYEYDEDDLID